LKSSESAGFNWNSAITDILTNQPENKMKIKKLKKKILNQFKEGASNGKNYSDEKLILKFTKKLNNSTKFKIINDHVCLER